MEETTNNTGAEASKRPTFLTVLCILTWVGCGISIIMGFLGFLAAKAASAFVGAATDMAAAATDGMTAEGEAAVKAMNSGMTNIYIYIIGVVVAALLCLFGSIQMWKLKKTGFFIYVAGQVIGLAIPFIFPIGGTSSGMMSGAVGMIFPVLFIVLYGLNLKHLK